MKKLFSLFSGLLALLSCLAPAGSAQSINPGTEIQVRLLGQLDTGKTEPGQEFSGTLGQPVRLDNGMVWPTGTEVKGKVVELVSSGRLSRPASITLQLTQIGNSPIETETEQIHGQSHAGRNAALISGIAAAGAVLGGVAGGGKGAVIGAAAGAGAGTATAAATGKQEIVLPAETPITFVVAGNAARSPAEASAPAPEWTEAAEPQNQPQASDYEPYAPEQLDNLLAPIALYPDPLLAQVLAAATFPDEIQEYDPGVIYVQRVYRPGFGFDGFFNFGTGFVIGSWLNYDMDWGTHRVVYNSWDERGGWRERSRPYVHITNVYVNNRYENVNLNRNVVHRHVDYDNVQRYNSVHHDVTYKNRERPEPERCASPRGL